MKRVVMAGRLGPLHEEVFGMDLIRAEVRVMLDGDPELYATSHNLASGAPIRWVQNKVTYDTINAAHPDELMPRVGDVVRFRYAPNDLEVMSVRHTHEGAVAVVHQMGGDVPQGGFAAPVRDLRIVKRLTTD